MDRPWGDVPTRTFAKLVHDHQGRWRRVLEGVRHLLQVERKRA
jgi:hypothetical protein